MKAITSCITCGSSFTRCKSTLRAICTRNWLNEINGDPITRGNMDISRSNARTNLARLRSNYNATLPAGQRRTWHMA